MSVGWDMIVFFIIWQHCHVRWRHMTSYCQEDMKFEELPEHDRPISIHFRDIKKSDASGFIRPSASTAGLRVNWSGWFRTPIKIHIQLKSDLLKSEKFVDRGSKVVWLESIVSWSTYGTVIGMIWIQNVWAGEIPSQTSTLWIRHYQNTIRSYICCRQEPNLVVRVV